MARLTRYDFERLLEFRVTLRRFERWSEDQAHEAGLTHVQHQLLVAIKGHRGDKPPAVRELADYLLLRAHSTVELIDRAEAAGLVDRTTDPDDGRVVRVRLTAAGDRILQQLTRAHLDRLHELARVLDGLVAMHHTDGRAGLARREGPRPDTQSKLSVTQCTSKSAMARAQGGMTAGIKYAGDIITGRRSVTSWLYLPIPDVIRMRTVHSYSAAEATGPFYPILYRGTI